LIELIIARGGQVKTFMEQMGKKTYLTIKSMLPILAP
jgi:hypothetical protein